MLYDLSGLWWFSVLCVLVCFSVRVVNVQCYMICVVYGGLVYFMFWRASVDRVVNVQCYMICVFRVV